jgi:hypothetical protein
METKIVSKSQELSLLDISAAKAQTIHHLAIQTRRPLMSRKTMMITAITNSK